MRTDRSAIEPAPIVGELDRASAELVLASAATPTGERQVELVAPGIHCAGCIARIERALVKLPHVTEARVNLSTKRVRVRWRADTPPPVLETLASLGFSAHPVESENGGDDRSRGELIRALAVAGFAAMNIMLLSVSVWSGADAGTRQLFHWLSALIALPTLMYSGGVFFRSAWRVLRHGRTNMDVPISVGVVVAFALSLYETITHGPHAYFDASVTLLFFLLVGRTLDHEMRERARAAVRGLAQLAPRGATIIGAGGAHEYLPLDQVVPGARLIIAAGERVAVNARVISGVSEVDVSLLTGESALAPVGPGSEIWAGTLNLSAPLVVEATAAARDSFLAEMMGMMEAAEGGRSVYRRIADRAAELYAPVVHLTALLTLIGWWIFGGDFHQAVTIAVAVLIITCPCALGLAVPMVHVAAARRLFERGIMVKDGAALERLAEIDGVIFDKTGTLTMPEATLDATESGGPQAGALAAALAAHSVHPYARAIAAFRAPAQVAFESIRERPAEGMEGRLEGALYRLGRAEWAGASDEAAVIFTRDGIELARYAFNAHLRPDIGDAFEVLKRKGLDVEIISGDHHDPVAALARELGVSARARVSPGGKVEHIAARAAQGGKVLMVGDGLNDGPALMAAHVSMAPASAADVGRNAADFVFLRPSLTAVPEAIDTARGAARLVRQNISFAVAYNVIAVPIAIAGYVTPLIAAVAMSLSSVLVVANALRLADKAGYGAQNE